MVLPRVASVLWGTAEHAQPVECAVFQKNKWPAGSLMSRTRGGGGGQPGSRKMLSLCSAHTASPGGLPGAS